MALGEFCNYYALEIRLAPTKSPGEGITRAVKEKRLSKRFCRR
jgi:hypothetical protein